ncbi:MAG: M64 family metallopeptidase [Pseudomonadota bacterium]|nr:M64 family metallopeptidase [Pseudomonadota bacterium]
MPGEETVFSIILEPESGPEEPSASVFSEGVRTSSEDGEAGERLLSAEVRLDHLEVFAWPDSVETDVHWVETQPRALVAVADVAAAETLRVSDSAGRRFRARRVQRLPALPAGRIDVLHRGSSSTFDLVLVSEGFAEADRDAFAAAASALAAKFLDIEPFRTHRSGLSLAALFLPAPQSGITETNCGNAQHNGGICRAVTQIRQTLFATSNMREGLCRLIVGEEDRVRQALGSPATAGLLAQAGIRPRLAVVVVNTRVYGGAGSSRVDRSPLVIWTSPVVEGAAVMAHEMGHALGLQDEYETAGTGLPPTDQWVNISNRADPAQTPWHCHATDHKVPTCRHHTPSCSCSASVIGTFEGAGHQPQHRYRPSKNCRMRTTEAAFCPICTRHIINRLSGVTAPLCE